MSKIVGKKSDKNSGYVWCPYIIHSSTTIVEEKFNPNQFIKSRYSNLESITQKRIRKIKSLLNNEQPESIT